MMPPSVSTALIGTSSRDANNHDGVTECIYNSQYGTCQSSIGNNNNNNKGTNNTINNNNNNKGNNNTINNNNNNNNNNNIKGNKGNNNNNDNIDSNNNDNNGNIIMNNNKIAICYDEIPTFPPSNTRECDVEGHAGVSGGDVYREEIPSNDEKHSKSSTWKQRRTRGRHFTDGKMCLLVCCVLSHFMSGLSTSLLAPFYPQEALKKGMSLTLIGVTFSLFPFLGFIVSPLVGSYMIKIGPKFLIISGMFVGGVCNILYGTLEHCPSGTAFVATSLACRFVEGVGFAVYFTAIFAVAASEFPHRVTTVVALLQTGNQVGLMLGPGVGGFLYELGGFGAPFYVTGTVIVLNATVLFKVLPHFDDKRPRAHSRQSESESRRKKSSNSNCKLRSLFSNGLVVASAVSKTAISASIAFLEATLANHLGPLGLSSSTTGLMFTVVPILFATMTPISGFLTDHYRGIQNYLMVLGQLVVALGFYLLGPGLLFPFLSLNIWTVVSGLALIGASVSGCTIPAFKGFVEGALESGWGEDINVFAMASSVDNTVYSFGAFSGPLVGSYLVEQLGYRFGYTVVGTLNVAACVLTVVIFTKRYVTSKRNSADISAK